MFLKADSHKPRIDSGFTLIELLVVIAIIGLLSSIVLASLGAARDKAKDASAIASMASMRSQAELYVGSDGKYPGSLCTDDTGELATLIQAVDNQVGGGSTVCNLQGSLQSWAVGTLLNNNTIYCVDSAGASKVIPDPPGFGSDVYSCP